MQYLKKSSKVLYINMTVFQNIFLTPLLRNKDSNNNAICVRDKFITYSELFDRIDYVITQVKDLPDKYIGLYATDNAMTYASIVGLWFCGKAYVPLNPNQPLERHLEVINSVGLQNVLTSDVNYNANGGTRMIITGGIDFTDYKRQTDLQPLEIADDELAYILFTSGSTGKPKGVQINRGNVGAFIDSMNNIGLDITEKDKCLQPFDLTFDFSVSSYLIPLVKGACMYTVPNKAVKFTYIAGLLEDYHLTVLQMVPSMIRNLLPYMDEVDTSCVKYNILCGEALFPNVIIDWHKSNPDMVTYNMYGPTEDTVFCTYYLINKDNINDIKLSKQSGAVSIGIDFKNNESRVIDENGSFIETTNVLGELCLCGSQLSPGYWQRPDENRDKFFDDEGKRWYKTGDLCYLADDGNFMHEGRSDSQVKINGFRVELVEIENVYKKSTGKFCVVLPYTNAQNNIELAIIIESKEYDYTDDKVKLMDVLPAYEIPSRWVFMPKLPLNQNGKIDRRALKELINKQ